MWTGGAAEARKIGLEAEVARLEGEARALEAEAEEIKKSLEHDNAEIDRLSKIDDHVARMEKDSVEAIATEQAARAAEVEQAREAIAERLQKLKGLLGSAGRVDQIGKKLLGGIGEGGGAPRRDELDALRKLGGGKGAAGDAIRELVAALASEVAATYGRIAERDRTIEKQEAVRESCGRKRRSNRQKLARTRSRVERNERRLARIGTELDGIRGRIAQLRAAISLIDAIRDLIEQQERTAQARHEQKLETMDDERRRDRAKEVERAIAKLEETSLHAREAEPDTELLREALAEARAAAVSAGEDPLGERIAAIERDLSHAESAPEPATRRMKARRPTQRMD